MCYNKCMKILLIISLFVWSLNSYGLVCTASPTNNDVRVISSCYAKMLSHFERILKQKLAYIYASNLKHVPEVFNDVKNVDNHLVASYVPLFNVLEQVQRMLHKLNYPDPRPAVRCETSQNGE